MNEINLKLLEACKQMLHVIEGDEEDEAFDWVREVIAEAEREAGQ